MSSGVTSTLDSDGGTVDAPTPHQTSVAESGMWWSPEFADAIEAVARMLPTRLPEGGAYGVVARAALDAALPHLVELLAPPPGDLRMALLDLHYSHDPWTGGLPVCHHDDMPWPCPTARLCLAPAEGAEVAPRDRRGRVRSGPRGSGRVRAPAPGGHLKHLRDDASGRRTPTRRT